MTTGQHTPFDDLLLETKDGEWGEGGEAHGHTLCEIVRGTDFADLHDADLELPRRWIPDHLVERKALRPGDILIETAGGTAKQSTGRTSFLTESFFCRHREMPVLCSSFARHLRVDATKVRPDYLYYVLQALYRAGYMAVFNLQHTGVARFQFTAFRKKTSLELASREAQAKIAAILSAYDHLIANNQRRIALLEGMAQEIYREWFVRMRFPGHESCTFRHGVPQAWPLRRLGTLVELCYGKALQDSRRVPGDYLVYGSGGIVGTHNEALVPRPGLIVGRKGNVGAVYYSDRGFFPIDTVYYVVSDLPDTYLFFVLRSMNFINNDSAVPGLNRAQAYANELYLPLPEQINAFDRVAKPLFDQQRLLRQQIERLQSLRDALLTRLISGKLKVDHLDIRLPPSMRAEAEAVA